MTGIRRKTWQRGFTLIEMMLVIGLIGIIASFGPVVLPRIQAGAKVDEAVLSTVQLLRRAQTLSRSNEQNSAWGVHLATGQAVLFQGSSYAGRVVAKDDVVTLSPIISWTGINDVVFTQIDGFPSTTGIITAIGADGEQRSFTLGSLGVVSY